MSHTESASGFGIDDAPPGGQTAHQDETNQKRANGRASADILSGVDQADMSNGFDPHGNHRPGGEIQTSQPQQKPPPIAKNQVQGQESQPAPQQRPEEPLPIPVLLAAQSYPESIALDRVQYVSSQAGGQGIHPSQFAGEYIVAAGAPGAPVDSIPLAQMHNALYSTAQTQYVSRADPREIYSHIANAQAGYAPYVGKAPLGLPPSGVASGYVHISPQVHYGQYPQTILNPGPPYPAPKPVFPPQTSQYSPNPILRFPQEMSQYQNQPIVQPIAQNVGGDKSSRGPKPVVPPRINSKITHDTGHRKTASVDVISASKSKTNETDESKMTQDAEQDGKGKPCRTRQDGLYADSNGDTSVREKIDNCEANSAAEHGIYVSRPERRKSISVDVSGGVQRRNDNITFTFPNDVNSQPDSTLLTTRKPLASVGVSDSKPLEMNPVNLASEQKRLDMNAAMRMSPMPILPPLNVIPKGILVSGERKSVEWSTLNPNQRIVLPQENRRSEYFEEHRRSPMTIDGKRFDEVRRSPMNFIPIRDANVQERMNQKSPNNLGTQNFEKTRAELAMWAEQRQKLEQENKIMQQSREIMAGIVRSRNHSEERRPEGGSKNYVQADKDARLSVPSSAFQPIASISPNSIIEQRRHLRHVSADLTKNSELSRKEHDEQPLTGSVINLGTTASSTSTANVVSQRVSPRIGYQHPAQSESKMDSSDHIIHSHRKSSTPNLGKGLDNHSQSDNLNDKEGQLPPGHYRIDFIAEKLSQCERQQNDLHAKLQSLQNRSEILDRVAQVQYMQSDLHARMQNIQLQNQLAERFTLHPPPSSEYSSLSEQEETNQLILNQCINASRLYQQSMLQPTPSANYMGERVSPRLRYQHPDDSDISDSIQIPSISQMPLPSLSQFDRNDVLNRSHSYSQRERSSDNLVDSIPGSLASSIHGGSMNFTTGTLKKVPPEKPPRTSLIVQSPDTEVN